MTHNGSVSKTNELPTKAHCAVVNSLAMYEAHLTQKSFAKTLIIGVIHTEHIFPLHYTTFILCLTIALMPFAMSLKLKEVKQVFRPCFFPLFPIPNPKGGTYWHVFLQHFVNKKGSLLSLV